MEGKMKLEKVESKSSCIRVREIFINDAYKKGLEYQKKGGFRECFNQKKKRQEEFIELTPKNTVLVR